MELYDDTVEALSEADQFASSLKKIKRKCDAQWETITNLDS